MTKISKSTLVLIIIIAAISGGYTGLKILKNKDIKKTKNIKQIKEKNYSDIKISSEKKQNKNTVNWNICNNARMHYKISYPSDWKMYEGDFGPPSSVLLSKCDGNDRVVFASGDMWIKPPGVKYLDIDISNQERLNETIYKGSKTLDEYFSRNPLLLNDPIIKETNINGERTIWLRDLPSPYFMFFYNGSFFEIQGYNLNSKLFNDFLSTFKFVD